MVSLLELLSNMTVKQLINQLSNYEGNVLVYSNTVDNGTGQIQIIEGNKIVKIINI